MGEPIPEIVEHCERLLEMAKGGEMRAVAFAYVLDDGSPSPIYGRNSHHSAGTFGDLMLTLGRLKRELECDYDSQ
jgi:hypothetical protein